MPDPTQTTDPRVFKSSAFDSAHAAVRREQASFYEMLKTWRQPVQKGSDDA